MPIFDREQAETYDEWYEQSLGDAADKVEKDLVLDLLDPEPGERALDLGCGTGNYLFLLQDLGLSPVGIDISEPMLKKAEAKARENCSSVEVLRGDIQDLPFEDRTFDIVLSVTTFEFLEDPQGAAEEAWRVLKPGGRLAIGVIAKGSSWAAAYEGKSSEPDNPFDQANFYRPQEVKGFLPHQPDQLAEALYFDPTDAGKSREELIEKEKRMAKNGEKRGGFICAKWSK